jgi:hypothetical protein
MKLTPKALRALEGSIKKWRAILEGTGEDKGTQNCPLCIAFFNALGSLVCCNGCPVASRRARVACRLTPYEKWCEHQRRCHLTEEALIIHCPTCTKLAKAEVAFLVSLLPKGVRA